MPEKEICFFFGSVDSVLFSNFISITKSTLVFTEKKRKKKHYITFRMTIYWDFLNLFTCIFEQD